MSIARILERQNETKFYTYLLIDPRTNQPFYVGKGTNNRFMGHQYDALSKRDGVYIHNKPHHVRIREILLDGLMVVYEKVLFQVTEKVALAKEKELIRQFGRVSNGTGILLNISRGGQTGGETCKPVSQYTKTGELVNEFESALVASLSVSKANASYICQCCQGKRVSAGGFLWAYKGESPKKATRDKQRGVNQYSLSGELIATHVGITEAAGALGLRPQDISSCCRHKVKTVGRFIWAYVGAEPDLGINKTKYAQVHQCTMDGEIVATFNNARTASKELGLVSQNIIRCCDGKQSNVGGYLWKYAD